MLSSHESDDTTDATWLLRDVDAKSCCNNAVDGAAVATWPQCDVDAELC
jgi:hypothetical protein